MATYNRKLKDLHILHSSDCHKVLATFKDTILGDTNYKHFIANHFGSQPFFVDALEVYLIPPSACRDQLLVSYPPSFYAQHDALVATTILNRYTSTQLVNYLLDCSNRNILINYLYSINPNGIVNQALLDPMVGCTMYLNMLDGIDPALIGNLYAFFGGPPLPPPPPPVSPMQIGWLCGGGAPSFLLANQILAFNGGAALQALQSLGTPQLMSILNAVYPGGIPITTTQLQMMYSTYDLVHCIEQQDPTLQGWLLSGSSGIMTNQLLDIIKLYDGSNFVNAGLGCDITWAESILCGSGYDMNTFVQLMATDPDPTLHAAVNDFWVRWNGTPAGVEDRLSLNELVLYGSKRLGVVNVDTTLVVSKYDGHTSGEEMQVDYLYSNTTLHYDTVFFTGRLVKKWYELSNHLGNVVTVISDRKMAVDSSGDSTIDYFDADVRSAQEYYAYGGILEKRSYASTMYRFGMNGQEKDSELNAYNSQFWEYDPRAVLRWDKDPVITPMQSRYAVFNDNPIYFKDPTGAVPEVWEEGHEGNQHYIFTAEDGDEDGGGGGGMGLGKPKNIYSGKSYGEHGGNNPPPAPQYNVPYKGPDGNWYKDVPIHYVFEAITKEIYQHTVNALKMHPEWELLTYNGGGKAAEDNRRTACNGVPMCERKVRSRDEFPYAIATQGGRGAMVQCVLITEQDIQREQLRIFAKTMKAGDQFLIVPVPSGKEMEPAPKFVPIMISYPDPSNAPPEPTQPDSPINYSPFLLPEIEELLEGVGYLIWAL